MKTYRLTLTLSALGVLLSVAFSSCDDGGDDDCGECFRAINCVEYCGGPVIQSGCCPCPEGTHDDMDCQDSGTDGDGDSDSDVDSDADGDGDSDADGDGEHACVSFGEVECTNANGCMQLFGREVLDAPDGSPEPFCTGPREFLGCDQVGGCGDAETFACDPDSTVYYFSNTCVPSGFTSCEPGGEVGAPCE